MQFLHYFRLLFLFVFVLQTSFGQVTFEAKLSKTRLGLNERLRVSFEMNENGDNFIPPVFNDFNIVGGPNQSVSNSWVNGVRSFSKSYTYFLSPKRKGELKIGQAIIEIDGEVYKTSPKTVEVTEAVSSPNSPESQADAIADENLHLVAEISKSNPYLNEAITVIYKLYFSSEISISNVNEVETPKYSDFWSHQIAIPKLEIKRGNFKGQKYNYVTWRKTVLYPQKVGKLSIAPLSLNVSVDVPTNRRDFFGRTVYQKAPKIITAGRRTINVKALPEENKPSSFNGAVGDFKLDVSFNKVELKSSESFQTSIKVEGRGNLSLFRLPKLSVPSSLELYEPEHKENIKTNLLGMQGTLEDIYTIVPQFQGNYPIPPVRFSYFDPVKERYYTLDSKETLIDVIEGPKASNSSQPNAASTQNKINNESYFNFIKLDEKLSSTSTSSFYLSNTFWIILILPVFAFCLFLLILRRKENYVTDPLTARQKRTNKLARKYLSSAKKAIGDQESFYDALERAMHNYLKAKLAIETVEFSKDYIYELLIKKGASKDSVSDFITILNNCEVARYAPSADGSMQSDYDKATDMITTIDREI